MKRGLKALAGLIVMAGLAEASALASTFQGYRTQPWDAFQDNLTIYIPYVSDSNFDAATDNYDTYVTYGTQPLGGEISTASCWQAWTGSFDICGSATTIIDASSTEHNDLWVSGFANIEPGLEELDDYYYLEMQPETRESSFVFEGVYYAQ
jgi:hypothetical protein